MSGRQFLAVMKKYGRELPEVHFMDDYDPDEDDPDDPDDDGFDIYDPIWYGEGSGRTIDVLRKVLEHTTGSIRFVMVFESGSTLGLIVDNGVVRDGVVKITVEDPPTKS